MQDLAAKKARAHPPVLCDGCARNPSTSSVLLLSYIESNLRLGLIPPQWQLEVPRKVTSQSALSTVASKSCIIVVRSFVTSIHPCFVASLPLSAPKYSFRHDVRAATVL